MKFKGQGKINICGFEYKKNIADSRRGGSPVEERSTRVSREAALAHDRKRAIIGNFSDNT